MSSYQDNMDDIEEETESLNIYKDAIRSRPPLHMYERKDVKPRYRKAAAPTLTASSTQIPQSDYDSSDHESTEDELTGTMKSSTRSYKRVEKAKKKIKSMDYDFIETESSNKQSRTRVISSFGYPPSESINEIPEEKKISTSLINLIVIGVITILLLFLALIAKREASKTTVFHSISNLDERMNEKFSQLQKDFPIEMSKYKLLKAAVKAIVTGEPKQPAIVTFLALSGAEKTASCFARTLAVTVESIFDENKSFIHMLGRNLIGRKLNAAQIKEDLDDAAHGGFKNGSRVFLLENFNVIPVESAMIFHGLCDDNHAPFRKVLYLFTIDLVDLGVSSFSKDKELKKFEVTKSWVNNIHENQLSSLESRIGTYKILIEPEESVNHAVLKEKWNC